ncbi:hypothetical protein ACQY0O_003390 [Thecaphora frezii]
MRGHLDCLSLLLLHHPLTPPRRLPTLCPSPVMPPQSISAPPAPHSHAPPPHPHRHHPQPPSLLALILPLVLLLARLAPPTTAAQLPFRLDAAQPQPHQHPHLDPASHRPHSDRLRAPHAADFEDDDPAVVPSLRLSHIGLYINHPHLPGDHAPTPSLASNSSKRPPTSPFPLTVFVDTAAFRPESAVVRIGPVRSRTRDDVMLECGSEVGGIESCEDDDLASDPSDEAQETLECHFAEPDAVETGGRLVLSPRACPGWHEFWSSAEEHQAHKSRREGGETLDSFVIGLSIEAQQPDAVAVSERWWVGHLRLDRSRASWPLAGNALSRQPGNEESVWHPDNVNRISGTMQDPLLPKTSHVDPADPQQGVYIEQSSWNLGVQIRIPSATTNPRSNRTAAATGDGASLLLPPEKVFAPVAGQVVWSRPYVRRKPPLVGAGAGLNDEVDHCLMIRDEWSIVYQIFGIDPATIAVGEGDEVARGEVLGHALREGLSSIPPSTEAPADHGESKDDRAVRFYPYRYRKLEVRVARPHRSWREWKDPDEVGWQFFQPLQVLREGRVARTGKRYRSGVPPYGSPTTMYFARPAKAEDGMEGAAATVAFASSEDFFTPTLEGKVVVVAGFEAFQQTPGDVEDGMEPVAVYAMDLGVRKWGQGQRVGERERCSLGGEEGEGERWRTMWEHSKIPNAWTSPFLTSKPASVRWQSKLLSHYQASLSYGRFFPTRFTSQFDEKAKRLFYVVGRQVRGEPKIQGALDVRRDLMYEGPGRYRLVLRARDFWGNTGCVDADVVLQ